MKIRYLSPSCGKYLTSYPTALEACRSIVFTHGVRMGGQTVGKVCPGCISETVRCRKLILGRHIG